MRLHYLLLCLLCVACAPTRKACETNYGPCGFVEVSREIMYRDTTIYLPGAHVTDTFTLRELDTLTLREVVLKTDSSGRVALRWYRDAYGRLQAECVAKKDTVTVTKWRTTVKEVRVKQAMATPTPPGWIIATIVLALLLLGAIVFLVWRFIRSI